MDMTDIFTVISHGYKTDTFRDIRQIYSRTDRHIHEHTSWILDRHIHGIRQTHSRTYRQTHSRTYVTDIRPTQSRT